MTPLLLAVIAYLGLQFGIGIWASKRVRTEADYLVAGRKLGYWLAIFSIFATWFGAETVIGSAGRAYRDGVSFASAEPFGYGLCLLLMGAVFAVPLWRRGLTTIADLYRQRFSASVERFASLLLIPSSVIWAAAQMRAFGHVLSTTSALPVEASLLIAAAFCVAYTAFGGLLADAVTDLVQGILLILGIAVLAVAVVWRLGGIGPTVTAAMSSGHVLPPGSGVTPLAALEAWAIPVGGSVLATELVARVIATRSPVVAQRSAFAAGAMYLAVGLMPVGLGLAATSLIPNLGEAEQVLPRLAREVLPTAGYAIFAGGVISAILSTVDSTLLACSGLLSHNVIVPLLRSPAPDLRLRLARWGVVGFGLFAYVLARHAEGVYALVEQASAFGGAGVPVTVCFGLFSTRGGARTAHATLTAGLVAYSGGALLRFPYPFLASIVASVATYVVGAVVEGQLVSSDTYALRPR
jgi:SSS family transporter